jgi:hypothetical protein
MLKRLAAVSLLLALSATASATPARIDGLSRNGGFTDDSDFFLFPSVLGDEGQNVWLHYDGAAQGGISWENDVTRALYFNHVPAGGSTASGAPAAWVATFTQASDGAGFSGHIGWDAATLELGGAYGKGEGGDEPTNWALSGNLLLQGRVLDDSTTKDTEKAAAGIDLTFRHRKLTDQSAQLISVDVDYREKDRTTLTGAFQIGPRFNADGVDAALLFGPVLGITSLDAEAGKDLYGKDVPTILAVDVPVANVAAEYAVREWMYLRGAATAGWHVDTLVGLKDTKATDFPMVWSSRVGGSMGAGFKQEHASFDLAVNPGWAIGGPYFLSGAANPMLASISARIDL